MDFLSILILNSVLGDPLTDYERIFYDQNVHVVGTVYRHFTLYYKKYCGYVYQT